MLEEINIGKETNAIGDSPFRGCKNLRTINVDPGNRTYRSTPINEENNEQQILFNKNRSQLICFPPANPTTSYTIPDSVTKICEWSFAHCVNLKGIEISDSVDIIGENAFFKCTALNHILIPDGVDTIDDMAFKNCTGLKEIVIPPSVTQIGYAVFSGCNSIKIYCEEGSVAANYFSSEKDSSQRHTCIIKKNEDFLELYQNKMKEWRLIN